MQMLPPNTVKWWSGLVAAIIELLQGKSSLFSTPQNRKQDIINIGHEATVGYTDPEELDSSLLKLKRIFLQGFQQTWWYCLGINNILILKQKFQGDRL